MTVVFDTADVDAAREMLGQTYGRMRLTVDGVHRRTFVSWDAVGLVELHRMELGVRMAVDASPLGAFAISRLRAGSATVRTARRADDYRAGELYLLAEPEQDYRAEVDDLVAEFAIIPPVLLAQIAETAPGRADAPIAFTRHRPVDAAAVALWSGAFDYLRGCAPLAAAYPLLADHAGRLLSAAALAAFPNNALRDPTIEDRHDAHPATLRKALSFIDDNAQHPLSLADIAAAAHVTIRTVQLAFRRHLDTTPLAYLRRVRLEHAHHDLLDADPRTTTVTAVAARWGFPNHSRFTANYRAAYFVTPATPSTIDDHLVRVPAGPGTGSDRRPASQRQASRPLRNWCARR